MGNQFILSPPSRWFFYDHVPRIAFGATIHATPSVLFYLNPFLEIVEANANPKGIMRIVARSATPGYQGYLFPTPEGCQN